jgi:D-alanyl-D-alanine carboxypeptidase
MRRRDFLKAISATVILGTVEPFSFVSANQLLQQSQRLSRSDFDGSIKDYLHKMENFDQSNPGDIYLEKELLPVLHTCVSRLKRLQHTVGHGNFHLLSFDDGLSIARNYSKVGSFSREELDFLEMSFYADSEKYGFWGAINLDGFLARPESISCEPCHDSYFDQDENHDSEANDIYEDYAEYSQGFAPTCI